jgi:hypothetical protein
LEQKQNDVIYITMSELSIDRNPSFQLPKISPNTLRYTAYGTALLVGANIMLSLCGTTNTGPTGTDGRNTGGGHVSQKGQGTRNKKPHGGKERPPALPPVMQDQGEPDRKKVANTDLLQPDILTPGEGDRILVIGGAVISAAEEVPELIQQTPDEPRPVPVG